MNLLPSYIEIESGPCTRCAGTKFWYPLGGGWNRCVACDPPDEVRL